MVELIYYYFLLIYVHVYLIAIFYLKHKPRAGSINIYIYQAWNVSMKEINTPRLLWIARTVTKATAVAHKAQRL